MTNVFEYSLYVVCQLHLAFSLLFLHLTFPSPSQSSHHFSPSSPLLIAPVSSILSCSLPVSHCYSQTQLFSTLAYCNLPKCSSRTGSTLLKRQLVEQKDFLHFSLFCFCPWNRKSKYQSW